MDDNERKTFIVMCISAIFLIIVAIVSPFPCNANRTKKIIPVVQSTNQEINIEGDNNVINIYNNTTPTKEIIN